MFIDFEVEGHIIFIRNLMLGLILFIILINLVINKMVLNKYKKSKDGLIEVRIPKVLLVGNTLMAVLFGSLTLLVLLSNNLLEGMTMIVYLVSYVIYLLYVSYLYHAYFHFKFSIHIHKKYIEVINSKDRYKIYMESIKRVDKVSGYYIVYFNDEEKITIRRNMEGLDDIMNRYIKKYNIQLNF